MIYAIALLLAASQPGPWTKYKQPSDLSDGQILVGVFGVGHYSCAKAWTPQNNYASFTWVMGYVTGRNVADRALVGGSIDGEGIVGEVKLACQAEPSTDLTTMAERIYFRLKTQGR